MSQVALMFWMAQMLTDQPDLILAECVSGFKHLACLAPLLDIYEISSLDFSPTMLGIPSHRPRKYMLLSHKEKTISILNMVDFPKLFYKVLVANADLYCVEERALQEIRQEIAELPRKRRALTEDFGDDWRRLLTTACADRLRGWMSEAARRQVTTGWCNVQQDVAFMKPALDGVAPTLMRSSLLYSLGADRVGLLGQSLPCVID